MKRIYGHIAWRDNGTGNLLAGRSLCGKKVSRERGAPLVVCTKCVDVLMAEYVEAVRPRAYREYRGER